MILLPAIDLMGAEVVRLRRGLATEKVVYSSDPVAFAKKWEDSGADWLHIVDLDAAFTGEPQNLDAVAKICAAVKIPCELGGGMRSEEKIQAAFDAGAGHPHGEAARVVVAAVVRLGERALRVDRAAEFAAPDHEGVFEHAARLEVEQQAGAGLVGLLALAGDVLRQVAVLVPAAVEDLHHADAAFDHAAGEQAGSGEGRHCLLYTSDAADE